MSSCTDYSSDEDEFVCYTVSYPLYSNEMTDFINSMEQERKDKRRKKMWNFRLGKRPASKMPLDLLMRCVEIDPHCIRFIPLELLTEEMCQMAYHYDSTVFPLIPDERKDEEMCKWVLDNDPKNVIFVPEKYR